MQLFDAARNERIATISPRFIHRLKKFSPVFA
jgi:hypothetical protein